MFKTQSVVCSLGCLLMSTPSAQAQLPADRLVEYRVHADPTDPSSRVVLLYEVELKAAGSFIDSVGWLVQSVTVVRHLAEGGEQRWTETAPYVDSADGLWWVDHLNPSSPTTAEFGLPPTIGGTALAEDPAYADLSYELAGELYSPPPGEAPYAITTSLTYRAQLEDEAEPVEEGEDEPVEMANGAGRSS